MGDERTAHFLEKYLHESLLEKIIGRIYSAPAGDYRPRKELIEKAVREHQIAKEERASEELRSYKPGDELTSGLRDVVEACNLFLIRKLFAADGVPGKGFLCPEHHYLSFTDEQCPLCRKNPIEVESLLDELIEMARLHGAGVTIFEQKPNLVAAYEGVAALLYARANVV
jgi:peptide subunit release factor 1 (eRF1)